MSFSHSGPPFLFFFFKCFFLLLLLFIFFPKLHLKLPWGLMLGGGPPRWQIKDRIKGKRPCSAQAQLDTPIPPACPESHSSRSSSSLEHSAEDTMSSVVCGEREAFIRTRRRGCLLAGLTQSSLPVLRWPRRSIIFHSVYHPLLGAPCTPAGNCFPSPSSPCLPLFIAPLLLCLPQSMAPPRHHRRSTPSRRDLCRGRRARRVSYTAICPLQFQQFRFIPHTASASTWVVFQRSCCSRRLLE